LHPSTIKRIRGKEATADERNKERSKNRRRYNTSFATVSTRSISESSRTSGMKFAPMPWKKRRSRRKDQVEKDRKRRKRRRNRSGARREAEAALGFYEEMASAVDPLVSELSKD
jgi:hypothetical protein